MKGLAGMPDAVDALVERGPFCAAPAGGWKAPGRIVGGRYRVLRERVQDVGQHQLLMLLLVVEPDFQQRRERRQRVVAGFLKKFGHRGVDVLTIGGDLMGARTGQMAALVTGMPG